MASEVYQVSEDDKKFVNVVLVFQSDLELAQINQILQQNIDSCSKDPECEAGEHRNYKIIIIFI